MTLLTASDLAARWQCPVSRVHAFARSGGLAFIDMGDPGERARVAFRDEVKRRARLAGTSE